MVGVEAARPGAGRPPPAVAAPQLPQNLAPGASGAWHAGQARPESAAPHEPQKRPLAGLPQDGQLGDGLKSGIGALILKKPLRDNKLASNRQI